MTHLTNLLASPVILSVAAIVMTFLISYRLYPIIIYTVRKKNLMDEPGDRSIHGTRTPTLGGVGLFVAFALSLILFGVFKELSRPDLVKLLSLLAAIMILLFLGIKDDLIELSPRKKFSGQLISAAIVIFFTDVRIASFNGLLGIGELSYGFSVIFTVFVFILIINSYNMIDGIDGLAGSIALLSSAAFGVFFFLNDSVFLVLVSCILVGSIIGFLRYNLSDTQKLFMGDSGSLFIGYLLAYQGVSFLAINEMPDATYIVPNAQIMFIAILSFPLLDTLRVFVVRIAKNGSPFKADRNHIHHKLLHLGLEHQQATLLVVLSNLLIIGLVILMRDMRNILQLTVSVGLGTLLYLFPLIFLGRKQKESISNIEVIANEIMIDEVEPQEVLNADTHPTTETEKEEAQVVEQAAPGSQMQTIFNKRLEALKKMMVREEQDDSQ